MVGTVFWEGGELPIARGSERKWEWWIEKGLDPPSSHELRNKNTCKLVIAQSIHMGTKSQSERVQSAFNCSQYRHIKKANAFHNTPFDRA
ncbi:hypothetical protein AB205_0033210 [Aquarana catesbeiana]|uniref:Uncharacterized protein n=1 Tax=Aquarana catesbeiana TaxID=8400 RepID=A0A2G9SCP8_AQUCT|nr:hypothetical protein AB205_0033210 [Aquarana catesbeiana]